MKLLPKPEQDTNALINEIRAAGPDILAIKTVRVSPVLRYKRPRRIVVCESCGEAYPDNGSTQCPACQGMDIFV